MRITLVVLAGAAAALLVACQATPVLPPALQPDPSLAFAGVVHADGVQVYECRARPGAPQAHEWVFVAPEAELFDPARQPRGRHYAGPHWESPDGSKVVGALAARADAPAAGAIPWLLLTARSVGRDGTFSRVRAIQRVNTVGGVAPREACGPANAGQVARVPYTADYRLFAGRS